jgi:hypothetical protein
MHIKHCCQIHAIPIRKLFCFRICWPYGSHLLWMLSQDKAWTIVCVHDVATLKCRYGFLLPKSLSSQHDVLSVCVAILHQFGIAPEMYQIGITKLFFRAGQVLQLLTHISCVISSFCAMWSHREMECLNIKHFLVRDVNFERMFLDRKCVILNTIFSLEIYF